MVDQTTPETGVAEERSPESRVMDILSREDAPPETDTEAPQGEPAPQQAEAGEQPTDEVTADDLPDEPPKAAPSVDEFEIVHNGTQRKLNREETIKLAQQGFDYTQKTQALAEQSKQVQARLERLAQIEQVAPQLQAAQAQVVALGHQLAPYQKVDWVALASQDPGEYARVRAQYDVLLNTYQQAANGYQQISRATQHQVSAIQQQIVAEEGKKLLDAIPEWRDPTKYKAGAEAVRGFLIAEGATPEEVDGLTSSVAVKVARKAMLYDQLVKAKQAKVKELRQQPPVQKPGANPSRDAQRADKDAELQSRLKKSGSLEDATALLLSRMK